MQLFSHDAKADALAKAPLFRNLSRSDLVALAKVTEDMEFDEGKVLAREGEIGQEFFVIGDRGRGGQGRRTPRPRRLLRRDCPHLGLAEAHHATAAPFASSSSPARPSAASSTTIPNIQEKVLEAVEERVGTTESS